jgi:HK97 family phage major capsid protein
MTLKELIEKKRAERDKVLAERNTHATALSELRGQQTAGATVDEAKIEEHRSAKARLDADLDARKVEIDGFEAELRADEAADELTRQVARTDTRKPAYDGVARVGQEKRTYNPDGDKGGATFLRDVGLLHMHGPMAAESSERLIRHMAEERVERGQYLERAAGTGAFAGLTVPQYLTDMYAPAAKAMRPFADVCNQHPLPPDGMTVNLSRITTATSNAVQSSENAAVSETNIDDTLLTINVQTAAGQQTLSRQAVERGTGIEGVLFDDMYRAYHSNLDSTLINQATNGLTNVATAIAYTDATPTVAELYPKFAQALAAVEGAMLDQASGENVAVMHSRRWYWLQNALSSSWPIVGQPGIAPQMAITNYAETYGKGIRGVLPNGTPVIVDNNIATNLGAGTNEDEIYVLDRNEAHLWEDPNAPVFIRAEQPAAASLGILFVLYGYFAYSFARYTQAQKLNGTGLVTPTWTGV